MTVINNLSDFNTGVEIGTHKVGEVKATRWQLEEAFGLPREYAVPDKVTTEWVLTFEDGAVVTIYDWKRFEYDLDRPELHEEIEWQIGGKDYGVADRVVRELRR